MVPFRIPIVIRHLIFQLGSTQKGTIILTTTLVKKIVENELEIGLG